MRMLCWPLRVPFNASNKLPGGMRRLFNSVAACSKTALHIGAVAFIHRFGSSLNEHVHFHVCVVDGVFEEVAGSVIFHPANGIDDTAVAQVQAILRRRILRTFVARGLLESSDAKDMLAYQHSGFSVDGGVCILAHDRAAAVLRPPTVCHGPAA